MPALLLLTGPSAGRRYEVLTEATLGRSPSCEIPLEDDQVSRRHALITFHEGQAWIRDLRSRNGTLVNGERISGEVALQPGDQVRVGTTTALFEPPAVTLVGGGPSAPGHVPIEEVLPHVGTAAAMYSAGTALLGATSEAMVLRRLADEVAHALNADRAAALLGGGAGQLTASVAGAETLTVPRDMARAALERKELVQAEDAMCAPLVASGGKPFGVVYVTRAEPSFSAGEGQLLAALGRLGGEAYTAVRSRAEAEAPAPAPEGTSRPMRAVLDAARRAAASAAPVVVHGEPGTGKTLLARLVHSRSPRALGPVVTVDCRLPREAVEEALFGRASAPGQPPVTSALLRADGGALLLQHVEALPRPTAERLARLLARRAAPARQGGEEPVDVRVLATAPAPLPLLATRGEVEASLARGLAGFELEVPPLRDRRADVLTLLEGFTTRAARRVRKEPPTLGPEARRMLVDYAWPQNVRELELVGERLGLLYGGSRVGALHLPPEIQEGGAASGPQTLQERVARLERDAIAEALREAGGKKVRAAAMLGISRPTLDKKIEEYGLSVERGRRG
ncbi:FHA domain-containing protein [Myxococcus sp. RHSTA-1-4]|uniref:sigma-54-dependent Fis family transcriptional regulator n=1 Tax=Myxococcus sp. RHSTA-1-4 TaxID=2874601 RepID=UPI001CBF07B0|nr:FHA domain-containing protein [Myxococcus sp. RHSTA-1-4]MBZ4423123.1 FHA domain-containing protein [Myxococcus sp. RHSTA-1-4]